MWQYLDEGKIDTWKQILGGVIFGGLMSWIIRTSQKRVLKKKGETALGKDHLVVSHRESIPNKYTIDEIYDLLNSHQTMNKWKLEIKGLKIIGKTKTSWLPRGEKIIISDEGEVLTIESKPVLITTIFDDGKNKENVLLIKRLIEKNKLRP